jgi:KUP system potassium uptake protein
MEALCLRRSHRGHATLLAEAFSGEDPRVEAGEGPMSARETPKESPDAPHARAGAALALAALGVVYGDIGTSPLYAIRECFHGPHAVAVTHGNVLGVLSLVIWSLVLVVSVKYVLVILSADNRGEGGILALTTLVTDPRPRSFRLRGGSILMLLGLFAAALLYGDGVITPAISVLSAVEGIEIATPALASWTVPITLLVLVTLFLVQSRGTARVGALFGPIALVWFGVLAALGVLSFTKTPAVLAAFNPAWAVRFFGENGIHGIVVLGSVFLVATGAEAIYADLGHFGAPVIRRTWFAVALPALLTNYLGQGALLLRDPSAAEHPFYLLAPQSLLVPVLLIATLATCIASQAVITAAFSLTWQAIQLGYLPRLQVRHTSGRERGQIYIPEVNYLLLALTVLVVAVFRTSAALAAAYGIAVTSTMVITSVLLYFVLKGRLGRGAVTAGLIAGGFLSIDLLFFSANALKIVQGGWFPLVLAVAIVVVMTTWATGRRLLTARLRERSISFEEIAARTGESRPLRSRRTAVFMSRELDRLPPALWRIVRHLDVFPERSILVRVVTEPVPHVPEAERFDLKDGGDGVHRVEVRYGFMEEPDVPAVIARLRERGLDVDPAEVVYILGRETILATKRRGMAVWRERLFGFLARNAARATAFYGLPPLQVIEVGAEIDL